MAAEYAAVHMDDLAGFLRFGAQLLDDLGVIAAGDEAYILAVRFFGVEQAKALGMAARDILGPAAEGEAQEIKLFLRCREQEIALVFCAIDGAM